VLGLALTILMLSGLAVRPTLTLAILWDMVIPLLPMVFLINPIIWRNVCPLATLNALTGRGTARRIPDRAMLQRGWMVGIALLAVMVPARRFAFNEDGSALLVAVAVVALLALVLGMVFSRRSGFCNTICPVLPVEKLYGQSPLLRLPTARCRDCNACSAPGCIELAGGKSLVQSMGPSRHSAWSRSPLGVFTMAFPGFIIGYFTTTNGPLSSALSVYGHVALWTLGSLVTVQMLVRLLDLDWRVTLPVLGGAAAGAYYWFTAPALAEAYGLSVAAGSLLRIGTVSLTAAWLGRALWRATRAAPTLRRAGPLDRAG